MVCAVPKTKEAKRGEKAIGQAPSWAEQGKGAPTPPPRPAPPLPLPRPSRKGGSTRQNLSSVSSSSRLISHWKHISISDPSRIGNKLHFQTHFWIGKCLGAWLEWLEASHGHRPQQKQNILEHVLPPVLAGQVVAKTCCGPGFAGLGHDAELPPEDHAESHSFELIRGDRAAQVEARLTAAAARCIGSTCVTPGCQSQEASQVGHGEWFSNALPSMT